MDLHLELENIALLAESNDDDRPFQELFHNPKPAEKKTSSDRNPHAAELKSTYLVKLEGPLESASTIQELAGMSRLPQQVEGTDDDSGTAAFCFINGAEKSTILSALANQREAGGTTSDPFTPTFIRINRAEKSLFSYSEAPCLGHDTDTTLPHRRVSETDHVFLPAQDQYPVWYFFYGTLADGGVLCEKLGLDHEPTLRPASVDGAVIRTWGGKYKALVDGPGTVKVWAYEVACVEDEEVLRYYETDQYEVVRCDIHMQDVEEVIKGLTFRFTGVCDQD